MATRALQYNPQQRLAVLMLAVGLVFLVLIGRLVDLQIFKNGYYQAVAENQRKRASELEPHRGTIYMSEGKEKDLFPVASNEKAWIAYAIPRNMDNAGQVADELAPELYSFRERQKAKVQEIIAQTGQQRNAVKVTEEVPEGQEVPTPEPTLSPEDSVAALRQQLHAKFDQKTDPYEPLLKPHEVLDEELQAFLETKDYSGITVEEQERRIYPEGSLAAHVLGYVGIDQEKRIGRYGIEGFFDKVLEGDLGWLSGEHDARGAYIGVGARDFRPAEDGIDVVLTMDRVVQSFIEKELKAGVEKYGAERGSILVMDPKTGAVLGMATYPTFDPNTYYAVQDARVQLNPVVSDIFEPGSILKPVIMAGAIEDQLVTPNTTMVDNGPVKVDKFTINTFDGKHLGVQTMTQILEQSNNIGMVWLGQKMGAEKMYDYLRRFGLGERTGIELEGETQTNLQDPQKWNIATIATTSFGQGVAVTPIQALNAINAIANKGVLTEPRIVEKIKRANGEDEVVKPNAVRQVVSEKTAAEVSAMMVSVIENGVAGLARVPGYYLAGKTGTAQVPDERGSYSENRKIISFVGFGPIEDPKFSILIKLDNPSGLSFASGTAAPMFHNVADKLLNYYQVPPSYDDAVKQPTYQVNN